MTEIKREVIEAWLSELPAHSVMRPVYESWLWLHDENRRLREALKKRKQDGGIEFACSMDDVYKGDSHG
jgi:hypothetical protein